MSASLYQQSIKRLARAGHGAGSIESPDSQVSKSNPLCGDRVTISLRMNQHRIVELAHQTRGCMLCEAAASLIGLRALGLDHSAVVDANHRLRAFLEGHDNAPSYWPEFDYFQPARDFRSRHGCLLLPFEALLQASHPDHIHS